MIFFTTNWDKPIQADTGVGAASFVLMEQKTGRVLSQKDANTQRKIASITKIMTAILAIESGKMDEMVEITPEMVQTEGSSIYLKVGMEISLRDLVYGLMLRSGNDAAQAIAIKVGGSIPGFVHLMNEKATWLGMNNSKFTNPHGLDDEDRHVSTAYDMALLTRYAMENDEYGKIAGTAKYKAETEQEEWSPFFENKHRLIKGDYRYATGGKTGFTKKARRTLVTTASKDGLDLIVVTLDDPNDWADHINLFEAAFSKYQYHQFVHAGLITDDVKKIYKKNLMLKTDLSYPVTEAELKQVKIEYKLLEPKAIWKDKGKIPEVVGRAYLYVADEVVNSTAIYFIKNPAKEPIRRTWMRMLSSFIGVN